MTTRAFVNQTVAFDADGSSDPIFWPGGSGSVTVQGDMGSGTLTLGAALKKSGDGGDPSSDTYATVTDGISGDAVSFSGLTGDSGMKAIAFTLPSCYLKLTLASSTDPDFVAVLGRNPS